MNLLDIVDFELGKLSESMDSKLDFLAIPRKLYPIGYFFGSVLTAQQIPNIPSENFLIYTAEIAFVGLACGYAAAQPEFLSFLRRDSVGYKVARTVMFSAGTSMLLAGFAGLVFQGQENFDIAKNLLYGGASSVLASKAFYSSRS